MSSSSSRQPPVGYVGDEENYDDTEEDRDMVLSKEDFDILHALHRFVPLPALSSNILRIICDEDLQVANEEAEVPTSPTAISASDSDEHARRINNHSTSGPRATALNSELAGAIVPKHSPLTRRLSKTTPIKPRIVINLAPSPQYQKKLLQGQHEPVSNNEFDDSYNITGAMIPKSTAARELRTE